MFDGRFAVHSIGESEFDDAARRIADCSIEYVLDSSRGGMREPVAGFDANEPLGLARLQYLIDDRPPAADLKLPRRTMEMLGVYIRSLFADFQWLDTVTVPSNVQLPGGLFQLTVESGDVSRITLTDAKHRPQTQQRRHFLPASTILDKSTWRCCAALWHQQWHFAAARPRRR